MFWRPRQWAISFHHALLVQQSAQSGSRLSQCEHTLCRTLNPTQWWEFAPGLAYTSNFTVYACAIQLLVHCTLNLLQTWEGECSLPRLSDTIMYTGSDGRKPYTVNIILVVPVLIVLPGKHIYQWVFSELQSRLGELYQQCRLRQTACYSILWGAVSSREPHPGSQPQVAWQYDSASEA